MLWSKWKGIQRVVKEVISSVSHCGDTKWCRHHREGFYRTHTFGFLGDVLTAVGEDPVLGVNFMGEARGSFLGEIFVGGMWFLLFGCIAFSSSFFFIMASLELALAGEGFFFFGDGLMMSSDLMWLLCDGLLLLPAAEFVLLSVGTAAGVCFSSKPFRAWMK